MTDLPSNDDSEAPEDPATASVIGKPSISNKIERVSIVAACIAILGGFVLFVYGEQTAGIGTAGVVSKLIDSIGMGIFSVGVIIVAVWLAKWLIASFVDMSAQERVDAFKLLFKQLFTVVLNVVIYGGVFILALGALTALDGASAGTIVVVLITWAICITVFVFYRRFRKKHKMGYTLIGYAAMPIALLILGVFCAVLFFGQHASGAIRDLQEGPKTADVLLVQDRLDHPAVWYALVVQTDHVLTFYTADEKRIVLEVPDSDISQATVIDDYGDFVHLTYYPNTQIFCGATPWTDGRQVIGEVLFQELQEEYGFEL